MLGRLAELFPGCRAWRSPPPPTPAPARTSAPSCGSGHAREFVDSFARPELMLSAERKRGDGHGRVVELVTARPGRSGVVYAGSRDGARSWPRRWQPTGVPALAYHAGLDKELRADRLEEFLEAEAAVMVATIAFGMGVDKPDVRFVIHADPPASIEAYWQEIGRAGRDGEPAEGITLYGAADMAWALRRIDEPRHGRGGQGRADAQGAPALRHAGRRRLPRGRRAPLFRRGGGDACGQCDLCLGPPEAADATEAAQKALSAVHRLGGRFGRGRVVDHLLGKTKDVRRGRRRCPPGASAASSAPPAGATCSSSCCSRACCARTPTTAARWSAWATPRPCAPSTAASGGCPCARCPPERRRRPRRAARASAAAASGWAIEAADAPLFEALRAWRASRGGTARAALRHLPRPHPARDRPPARRAWPRWRPSAASARASSTAMARRC